MEVRVLQQGEDTNNSQVLVLPVLSNDIQAIYPCVEGLEASLSRQHFTGERGSILTLTSLGNYSRVILLGLGSDSSAFIDNHSAMNLGGQLVLALNRYDEQISICLRHFQDEQLIRTLGLSLICGLRLRIYRFDKYMTQPRNRFTDVTSLSTVNVLTDGIDLTSEIEYASALVEGVYFTRDLVAEPGNMLNSETYTERLLELQEIGVEVEVLGQRELEDLRMGALLSVNQASRHEARVVILRWNGGGDARPLAFVGKGVTFDTGGYALKPFTGMLGMQGDMAGSATVAGLFRTLALRNARVNAVGVVGLVENMVSSDANRPGDVVTAYSGMTIEVQNPDAEGRLVLADVLSYTQERFNPQLMIDLATLTGAVIVALGYKRAGLLSTDNELAQQIMEAGDATGERLWCLPVTDEYRSMLDSDIADIANIQKYRDNTASTILGAVFLREFVGNTRWAHLDVSGVTGVTEDSDLANRGPTGYGVRLLDNFIARHYEKR